MSRAVLLCTCFFIALSVVAARVEQYTRTDPCYITPEQLKGSIRAANMQRALCEGSNFKHASCSNYWMAVDEVRMLSAKFQRCLENIDAGFRSWVYGSDREGIPGAFAYQGVLDRLYVNYNATSLKGNATATYQQTLALDLSLFQQNLNTFLSLEANKTALALNRVDVAQEATRTTSAQEAQTTRDYVFQQHVALRTLVATEESNTRSFVTDNNAQTRTLASSEYESARNNQSAESSNTRAEDISQTTMTINHNLNEETTTQQLEDSQSAQTRSHHSDVLADTRSIIISEINTQLESVRSLMASEAQTTRRAVDSSAQQTRLSFMGNESATVDFCTTQISANKVANQNAAQASQQSIVQEYTDQTIITRNTVTAARDQELQTVNSTTLDPVQNSVVANQTAFRASVTLQETATRSLFTGTAVPEMLAATLGAQSVLNDENNTMTVLMVHMNLASVGGSFFRRFGFVDLFSRPNAPYLLQTQSIVNNTVYYYQSKYGPNRIGYAMYNLQTGNAKLAANDYNSAVYYWRKAYKDATTAY